jgi:AraC-like DNA-binding protein
MFNTIVKIMEKFFIITNLPIIAFKSDGSIISSSGYTDKYMEMLDENNIYERVLKELQEEDAKNRVTMPCSYKIFFTAFYVESNDVYRGLVIMGPHTCCKNHPLGIPYKPRCLMNNLISLFKIIEKDINYGRFIKPGYSFHVKRALDYIDSRYSDPITLEDVIDYLNINKSYFCTLFKKETGKTFTEYLNLTRIEKSKDLLLEETSSILDIALAVGFSNQNYFSILFKRYTGLTPMQFRKNGGLEKVDVKY